MMSDIRYAFRVFRRQPVLYGTAAAGLALAIGVSTAVFAILNVTRFHAGGVREPDSVLSFSLDHSLYAPTGFPGFGTAWAYSDAAAIGASLPQGDLVAVYAGSVAIGEQRNFSPEDHTRADFVSGNYFEVFGGRPHHGRLITSADDRSRANIAVLSHALWNTRFGGRTDVVGQTIDLDGVPFAIVGVAEPGFSGPEAWSMRAAGLWIPIEAHRAIYERNFVRRAADDRRRLSELKRKANLTATERESLLTLTAKGSRDALVWNPGVKLFGRPRGPELRMQLIQAVTSTSVGLALARGQQLPNDAVAVKSESLTSVGRRRSSDFLLGLTIGATLLVVLACANIANALVAAATGRRREFAVRRAIGASAGRLRRQMVLESALIAVAGGAIGYLLAGWIAPILGAYLTPDPMIEFRLDGRVAIFAIAMCLLVSLAAGLAPLRQANRRDILGGLKVDSPAAPGVRGGLRSALIAVQAAISIVVLMSAALLGRSLHHAATLDVGVNVDRFMEVGVGLSGYDDARADAYWERALETVRQLPGIEAVALTHDSPFDGTSGYERLSGGRVALMRGAGPDYFDTLQVRLLRGRAFTADEVRANASVAIISDRLAREFWGDESPIGDTVDRLRGPDSPNTMGRLKTPGIRVVGVAADVATDLATADLPAIYRPLSGNKTNLQLLIRTAGDPAESAGAVIASLKGIDPEQSPGVRLMKNGRLRELEWPRRNAALAAVIGAAAIALAVVGLIGVTAFVAGLRRHEVSVRAALGATRTSLMGLLCRSSLTPVAIGLAIGLIPAFWATRVLKGMLFGVSFYDPAAIVIAIVGLLGFAAAAAFVPASRASRANPADLLRET